MSNKKVTSWSLIVGALGIVYGDIGTSPLYAVRECFNGTVPLHHSPENVFGIISLIFWSLTVVVSLKYVNYIMLANNRGEGGIFALMALLLKGKRGLWDHTTDLTKLTPLRGSVFILAVFGAGLIYGDGVITPAISVLSAIEGLSVATDAFNHLIVPLTVIILAVLFLIQKRGTGKIGNYFGPIMILWFVSIALLGLKEIIKTPEILKAINPVYAIHFFINNGSIGFLILGAVVLCITGAEALYADMGHFGRKPIQVGWYSFVFPSLLLNYFGQGALILTNPGAISNPFYELVPRVLLYPMVALSTIATVIASQALICGVFSLTHQAVLLGYCPRLRIIHTSSTTHGQIYMPQVNNFLMIACILLVLFFQESSNLAGAYGLAVTGTMAITTFIFYLVITQKWHWPLWKALPLLALFMVFDLSFFASNLFKIPDGGWITLVIAFFITLLMTTWKKGRAELARRFVSSATPIATFIEQISLQKPHRVRGTAIFMTVTADGVPQTLTHHFKHNQVLHEKVLLLTIRTSSTPHTPETEKVTYQHLGEGLYRVLANFGFMEKPDVPLILDQLHKLGLENNMDTTTFYLGRETLLASGPSPMNRWRKEFFSVLSKNAWQPTSFFGIPPTRAIELGAIIEI